MTRGTNLALVLVLGIAGAVVTATPAEAQPAAAGCAAFAGGAGMPNPRQLSGEPRAEQSDPSGMITVRVTYDDFKDSPEGVSVVLVGYNADDTTSYQVMTTDKSGRVQFAD